MFPVSQKPTTSVGQVGIGIGRERGGDRKDVIRKHAGRGSPVVSGRMTNDRGDRPRARERTRVAQAPRTSRETNARTTRRPKRDGTDKKSARGNYSNASHHPHARRRGSARDPVTVRAPLRICHRRDTRTCSGVLKTAAAAAAPSILYYVYTPLPRRRAALSAAASAAIIYSSL